jgi:hypothetical protein
MVEGRMIGRRRVIALAVAVPLVAGAVWMSGHWPGRMRKAPPVFAPDGLAIGGIDPVACFEAAAPVRGLPGLSLDWMGAAWRFATEANRTAFAADPDRWAPRYGGYCAYAVSSNQIAPTEPEAFTVYGGRLYLNANLRIRGRWEADKDRRIARSDMHWPGVLG